MTKQSYPFSGRKANYNYAAEKKALGIVEKTDNTTGNGWQSGGNSKEVGRKILPGTDKPGWGDDGKLK
jgi:hypothetical protein